MSIFNETLPDFIQSEIKNRQFNTDGNRNNSLSTIMSSTSWVRLTSGVDTLKKDAVPDSNGKYNLSDYTSELAKKYIITNIIKGEDNFPLMGYSNKFQTNNRHGIRPLPGITSLSSQSYSANGSLRKVNIKFTCWDIAQLDILEILYMRPGYPLCVEWGWSHLLGDDKTITRYPNFGEEFLESKQQKSILELQNQAYEKIKEYKGNIDIAIGKIQNFSYSARNDGGFDCETTIVTYGEILDSLKINYIPFNSDIANISPFSDDNEKFSEGILSGILHSLDKQIRKKSIGNNWFKFDGIDIYGFSTKIPIDSDNNIPFNNLSNNPNIQTYITFESLFNVLNKYVLVGSKNGPLTKLSLLNDFPVFLI